MYRRNQVEWAIWQCLDRGSRTSDEPPKTIVHTVKRLLDVDRQLGIDTRAPERWKRQFAFLEGVPQGRGGEHSYRLEEVVSLWIGTQYLAAGLPQTEVIQFLRVLKGALDKEVPVILEPYGRQIEGARKQGGDLARGLRAVSLVEPRQHVYVLTEEVTANGVLTSATRRGSSKISNICHGREELLEFIETYVSRSKRLVVVEIANAVLSLAYFLTQAPLIRRGRPA